MLSWTISRAKSRQFPQRVSQRRGISASLGGRKTCELKRRAIECYSFPLPSPAGRAVLTGVILGRIGCGPPGLRSPRRLTRNLSPSIFLNELLGAASAHEISTSFGRAFAVTQSKVLREAHSATRIAPHRPANLALSVKMPPRHPLRIRAPIAIAICSSFQPV